MQVQAQLVDLQYGRRLNTLSYEWKELNTRNAKAAKKVVPRVQVQAQLVDLQYWKTLKHTELQVERIEHKECKFKLNW